MELQRNDGQATPKTLSTKEEETHEQKPLLLPGTKTGYKLYKWRWVVLGLFSLISMSNEIIWISLSSITSIVKDYYRVDSVAVNWLSLIFLLLYVFVIGSSYVLDKYGLKVTIIVGAFLNAIGSCLRAMGANRDGFTLAFLGNTFAALAQCFIIFIPPRLAAVWFGDSERATASSIGVLMNMLGVAVGFLLGTIVPSSKNMNDDVRQGMHRLLVSQAVFCTILAVASFFLIKKEPPTPPSRSQEMVLKIKRQDFVKEIVDSSEDDLETSNNTESWNVNSAINEGAHNTETSFFFQEDNPDVTKLIKGTKDSKFEISHVPSFGESILLVVKDKSFHLISQAYGIATGQVAVYNTLLNEMVISKYPGREKEIGYMGFAAGVCGLFGILFSGIILDRTKRYKTLSIIIFASCAFLMLIFTLLLEYYKNFVALFISFCAFGLFSYAYIFAGLEHAAELTYPVPEGTTSAMLFLFLNIYGIILTNIIGIGVRRGGGQIGGFVMFVGYMVSLVLISFVSGPLKRSQVDQRSSNL